MGYELADSLTRELGWYWGGTETAEWGYLRMLDAFVERSNGVFATLEARVLPGLRDEFDVRRADGRREVQTLGRIADLVFVGRETRFADVPPELRSIESFAWEPSARAVTGTLLRHLVARAVDRQPVRSVPIAGWADVCVAALADDDAAWARTHGASGLSEGDFIDALHIGAELLGGEEILTGGLSIFTGDDHVRLASNGVSVEASIDVPVAIDLDRTVLVEWIEPGVGVSVVKVPATSTLFLSLGPSDTIALDDQAFDLLGHWYADRPGSRDPIDVPEPIELSGVDHVRITSVTSTPQAGEQADSAPSPAGTSRLSTSGGA